ncbi:hypothetical protein [Tenacibaculum piscium]|uniref:hypothetical protein n=1 Tax=Tenacibaculum piscium TaxID=1458515 RepID=UPI001F2CA5D3|nr:hypothetical protein [Tenacibaculum piscium]
MEFHNLLILLITILISVLIYFKYKLNRLENQLKESQNKVVSMTLDKMERRAKNSLALDLAVMLTVYLIKEKKAKQKL